MSALSTAPPAVRLRGVSKTYGARGHETIALRTLDLDVHRGVLTLLCGPSGSGKTTLLTLMAGLLEPSTGRVELLGTDVARATGRAMQALRARRVGFVFQTFSLIDALTVRQNVCLVQRFAGVGRRPARRRAQELLASLGIAHLADKRPTGISQGEKQRVAIARALANDPDVLFADEPTANLDAARGGEIVDVLARAARANGRCVVVTSHDERVLQRADRVLGLDDGALLGTPRTGRGGGRSHPPRGSRPRAFLGEDRSA